MVALRNLALFAGRIFIAAIFIYDATLLARFPGDNVAYLESFGVPSFVLWPAQKNLGTLLSCSAAVMLGTQFWHAQGGGLYMGWYLPLLLLTIFRPNLEDRVALSTLGEGWFGKRRLQFVKKAA